MSNGGSLNITHEWQMASATLTLRHIAARDDTQSMPKVEEES